MDKPNPYAKPAEGAPPMKKKGKRSRAKRLEGAAMKAAEAYRSKGGAC